MVSFSTQAEIRFGYGLRPSTAAPSDVEAMLVGVSGPDETGARFPVSSFADRAAATRERQLLRRARRNKEDGAERDLKLANVAAARTRARDLRHTIARALASPTGFRERLVRFWADHFSVSARKGALQMVVDAYVEEAIRPHVGGTFGDLLRSAETHPVMLVYLDQVMSIGPGSPVGKASGRGLNENLAREILELHTLGVGGGYTQGDVRQFSELLTGLGYSFRNGFRFRPRAAEPGAETVLGQDYGGDPAKLADIHQVLADLAVHPDTARHIARKLVVHFVADDPPEALVAHVAARFRQTGGNLIEVYAALLEHPDAWAGFGMKARQPFDFIVAAMRALDIPPERVAALAMHPTRLFLMAPLRVMGQPFNQPPGPNGWPEAVEDWITPQGMAARIQWALIAANRLGRTVPPRRLAKAALGDAAPPQLLAVASAAPSATEGMALVLASPQFNRR